MKDSTKNISCPHCGEAISIDSVLTHQLEEDIKNKFKKETKEKEEAFAQKTRELEEQKLALEKKEKEQQSEINKKVADKLATEKVTLWKEAQQAAEKEKSSEIKLLEEQMKDKEEKLKEAQRAELELRKEKQKLKDEKDAFELEKARQLDEERKKIEEDASRKATEAQQAKIDQLNKQLSDATKAKDELARKLEQGSQQTQGEVQELILEETLKSEFLHDEIVPVPKGVTGADVIQTVHNNSGINCGTIIWESKNTKNWSEGWLQKLKDDQRAMKADIAVIVSNVLPAGAAAISQRDGVWVCDIKLAISLASVLRSSLISLTQEKRMSVSKDEKMEILYQYLTGTAFKQRIEAIVETFSSMDTSLKKERLAYEKMWSEREKQIQKVITNTVGIYGDLNGIVQLQKIDALELPEGDKDITN
jgi:hypothetical protein